MSTFSEVVHGMGTSTLPGLNHLITCRSLFDQTRMTLWSPSRYVTRPGGAYAFIRWCRSTALDATYS